MLTTLKGEINNILVVDDARFSGAVITRTLKSAGYKDVRSVNSAIAGLEEDITGSIQFGDVDWLF